MGPMGDQFQKGELAEAANVNKSEIDAYWATKGQSTWWQSVIKDADWPGKTPNGMFRFILGRCRPSEDFVSKLEFEKRLGKEFAYANTYKKSIQLLGKFLPNHVFKRGSEADEWVQQLDDDGNPIVELRSVKGFGDIF